MKRKIAFLWYENNILLLQPSSFYSLKENDLLIEKTHLIENNYRLKEVYHKNDKILYLYIYYIDLNNIHIVYELVNSVIEVIKESSVLSADDLNLFLEKYLNIEKLNDLDGKAINILKYKDLILFLNNKVNNLDIDINSYVFKLKFDINYLSKKLPDEIFSELESYFTGYFLYPEEIDDIIVK